MKVRKLYTAILLLGLLAVSCSQDPIFFIISTETAPIPPRIEGAPTNMVIVKRNGTDVLYVASGRLHWYARSSTGESKWDLGDYRIPQPGGKIISLAAAQDRLYALCLNNDSVNATLQYIDPDDTTWKRVQGANEYPLIQSIYADPKKPQLFAGARKRNSATFAFLYLDDTDPDDPLLRIFRRETAMLTGAVCREEENDNVFYLCTNGSGIFRITETDLTENTDEIPISQLVNISKAGHNSLSFMGMIKLKDESSTIIAVERNGGALYEILQDGSFAQMRNSNLGSGYATGRYATGALALWEDHLDSGKRLLVAGIQGGLYSTSTSSYTNGYVEFDLTAEGSFDTTSTRRDSNKLLTVNNTDRYTTSLGKHPINHLFQTPKEIDDNMTFFASTQTAGLWSYRDRPHNGGPQWNAEE